MIRWLAIVACALTVCITASSAFIRHSQAGLAVAPAAAEVARAADAAVAPPGVRTARALHRVSAMVVGVLVLLIAVFGWSSMRTGARVALVVALADTAFLAWLGRLTPHPIPVVTVGNLVGGIALAAAFAWIVASLRADARAAIRGSTVRSAAAPVFAAFVLLAAAAWLGTMISAHDVIGACEGVRCAGPLRLDASALDPMQAAQAIDAASARGLHWLHRGLAAAFAVLALLVAARMRGNGAKALAGALVVLLLAQVLTGVGTTLGLRPLATATLHNAFAALLAVTLAAIAAQSAHAARAASAVRSGFAARETRSARGDAERLGRSRIDVDAHPSVDER